MRLLVSCDRSGTIIPASYQFAIKEKEKVEQTAARESLQHLAKHFASKLEAKFFLNKISPLLIDCDRPVSDDRLFSVHTKNLSHSVKKYLIDRYYMSYRSDIRDFISKPRKAVHISFRSFSAKLDNIERAVDIGLIADNLRTSEYRLASEWKERISEENSDILVLMNVPFEDSGTGLMSDLKKIFDERDYLGIELKIKENLLIPALIPQLEELLTNTFTTTLFAIKKI